MEQNIKMLVIACNTSTAYALEKLQRILKIPVIGVIEPGAEKAVKVTKNRHIAVLGTKATISSGVYQREIKKKLPEATVISIPCPLFVPLVEENFYHHEAARLIVNEYLSPLQQHNIDTVLLGCTHYPLLKEIIRQELKHDVEIVDSASTCAEKVAETLAQSDLQITQQSHPFYKYFVSDDPKKFQDIGEVFLGTSINNIYSTQK